MPALDGRTPREAARTAEGREKLADLLHWIEETEASKPAEQRYDFGWIWSELGVEDLR